jgi:hypothetical protein
MDEAAAGDHEHTGASRGHTRPPYNSQVVVYTGAYTATRRPLELHHHPSLRKKGFFGALFPPLKFLAFRLR